jgi:hypothetical protein
MNPHDALFNCHDALSLKECSLSVAQQVPARTRSWVFARFEIPETSAEWDKSIVSIEHRLLNPIHPN